MRIQASPSPTGVGTDRVLEAFGAKIPMPNWSVTALASLILLIVLIGSTVYGWVWFRDHEKHDGATMQRVAEAEFTQLEESQKHFSEPAEVSVPIYQDARGLLKVSLYRSDSCILIERHSPDVTKPIVNQFVLDPSRLAAQPAPKFTQRKLMSLEGVAWAQNVPGPGRCWDLSQGPHPGVFRWWGAEKSTDGCWTRIHRRFEDNCEQVQDYNGCANVWSPTITWVECHH